MEENKQNLGKILHSWQVPEYMTHVRSKNWYIIAGVVGLLLMVYSLFTGNFLFAVIIIIAALIKIIHDGQKPAKVKICFTDLGLLVGRKFYEYTEIKNFAIVDRPHENIKNLYFEFKSAVKQRLSIPLEQENPRDIKNTLIKYLPEDKERTDIPVSEQLARLLKL